MQLNVDPGFDADLELAHGALKRGWVTRESIETAILAHEKTPGSRLLNHLPLTPDQLQRLLAPEGPMPPEIAKVANDPSRRLDHYLLGDFLHSGGMGRVYKAWDLKLSRWVALKCLKAVGDERSEAYFDREARLAAGLSHPNIAAIYASGRAGGESFIAMQLIPGKTLDQWGRRDVPRLVTWIRDAARAVAYANSKGIVHRDLKPTNLMVTPEGQVYVLDFGLARPVAIKASHSATGKAMGTPAYMSPEQARGAAVDARSDVYSLGATLFECLTGRAPFSGTTIYDVLRKVEEAAPARPRRLNPRIAPDLETIILKCLEKDAGRRYRTADELADDLERFLNHDPIRARPAGVVYRVQKNLAKRKAITIASLASVVLAGVLGWWFLVGRPHSEQLRVGSEHLRLRESAMKLWAEARGLAMAGVDPEGIRRRAKAAREAFERAIEVHEDPPTLVMKARCLQLENKDAEATKVLERANKLEPKHAEARLELAKALLVRYAFSRGTPSSLSYFPRRGKEVRLRFLDLPPETAEQALIRESGEQLLSVGEFAPAHRHLLKGLLHLGKGAHAEAAPELAAYAKAERWDAHALWLEGVCRYFAKDLPGSVAALESSASRVERARTYLWLGIVKTGQGSLDEAIVEFTRAIEKDPKVSAGWTHRGLAKVGKGDYGEAIVDFSKAVDLNPKDFHALVNRGHAKMRLGSYDEAIDDLTKAIELNPRWANAYENRASAKERRGLWDEAVADCNRALELDPKMADAYMTRASARREQHRLDEALADNLKALELQPDSLEALANLALVKDDKGLHEEAIRDYTKVLQLDPEDGDTYGKRGQARYKMGLVDEAIADYDRAIGLDPKNAVTFSDRGNAKRAKGLLNEAMADFTKAIELDPNMSAAFNNRGLARMDLGRPDEALADFTKAVDLNPKNAFALNNRGAAKEARGLRDEAFADYSKAIELDPKLAEAYGRRGLVKARKGLHDEAIADLTRAIELDPKNAISFLNRGTARTMKGLLEEALADFSKAIEINPKLASAYMNRGSLMENKGRFDQAIADYEMALKVAPPGWPHRQVTQELLGKQRAGRLFREGNQFHEAKKYREAIEKFSELVESFPKVTQALPSAYNVACGYALLGEKSKALEWLEKAVEMGWKDVDHIEKDSDLKSLRQESAYKELLNRLKVQ